MNKSSEPKSERLAEEIERLRGLDYIPKGHVDFFESIMKAHDKAKDRIAKEDIYPAVTKDVAQKMLADGFPLISFDRMKVQETTIRDHLEEICTILGKYDAKVGAFCESEQYKNLDVKEFVSKTASQDGDYLKRLSDQTGVDMNTLKFVGVTLARPLFELAANGTKEMVEDYSWWKNYCPACGSEPLMARLRKKDNMRILACSVCGTEWKFDRATCPFCNNKDQKALKFYYYHEESPHRLYVCDQCKRYIKCVDEKKMAGTKRMDLAVEDMATLYLDTLAKEKGYVSEWGFKETDTQEESPE